jgi:hypothetical protein
MNASVLGALVQQRQTLSQFGGLNEMTELNESNKEHIFESLTIIESGVEQMIEFLHNDSHSFQIPETMNDFYANKHSAQEWNEQRSKSLYKSIEVMRAALKDTQKDIMPPSYLTRSWIPCLIAFYAVNMAFSSWSARSNEIINFINSIYATSMTFVQDYIIQPTYEIIKTIRHKVLLFY